MLIHLRGQYWVLINLFFTPPLSRKYLRAPAFVLIQDNHAYLMTRMVAKLRQHPRVDTMASSPQMFYFPDTLKKLALATTVQPTSRGSSGRI